MQSAKPRVDTHSPCSVDAREMWLCDTALSDMEEGELSAASDAGDISPVKVTRLSAQAMAALGELSDGSEDDPPVKRSTRKQQPCPASSGCTACGARQKHSQHERCKARSRKCYRCMKWGHFAHLCWTS